MASPEWGCLPSDALRLVFAALPAADGAKASVRLVCRTWRQVADTSTDVWSSVAVRRTAPGSNSNTGGPAAASGQRRPEALSHLLERQRTYMRKLHVDVGAVGAEEEATAVAAVLLAAACGEGSGLTDLTLAFTGGLDDAVAQALPGAASQLTSLTLRQLSARHSAAIQWRQLAHLSQLCSLSLTLDLGQAGLNAAPLAALTSLTRLRLHGTAEQAPELAPALLACPTSLVRLELAAVEVKALRAGRWLLEGVGELEGSATATAGLARLAVSRSERSVTAVLDRWRQLEMLRLANCAVHAGLLQALPSLTSLTSLHLAPVGCHLAHVATAQQCSRLQELVIGRYSDYRLPVLPEGALSQLTRLRISGCSELMKLHASWCSLPNLLSLEMESCEQLLHLPLELSGLTQLERLTLSHQRMEELPRQLTGLAQLTRLAIAACSLEAPLPEGPYLRRLRELVLFANNLSCVPPALAHPEWGASRLRRLDLSSNYNHMLSDADVAVLTRLSCLSVLDLRRQQYSSTDGHPESLLREVRSALPRCDVLAS